MGNYTLKSGWGGILGKIKIKTLSSCVYCTTGITISHPGWLWFFFVSSTSLVSHWLALSGQQLPQWECMCWSILLSLSHPRLVSLVYIHIHTWGWCLLYTSHAHIHTYKLSLSHIHTHTWGWCLLYTHTYNVHVHVHTYIQIFKQAHTVQGNWILYLILSWVSFAWPQFTIVCRVPVCWLGICALPYKVVIIPVSCLYNHILYNSWYGYTYQQV